MSSDSDFARLAARIREQGVTVYGFGERKTNHAFIAACDKFVYFDVLNMSVGEPEPTTTAPLASLEVPTVNLITTNFFPSNTSSSFSSLTPKTPALPGSPPGKRPLDKMALDGLAKAIKNTPAYAHDDFIHLAEVGLQLTKDSPDLNARNYGYGKLWDLVAASGIAELKRKDMGKHASVALVRLKETCVES